MHRVNDLGSKIVSCFVIETEKGLIVVDSGYPKGFESFKEKFEKNGYKKDDVKFLFLTHSHNDHVGFLNEILGYFNQAKLILHKNAVERIKKGENLKIHEATTKRIQRLSKLLFFFNKNAFKYQPINSPSRYLIFNNQDDQFLKQNNIEIEIVELLGHTEDSIGLMLDGKRLICGDVVFNNALSHNFYPLVIEDKLKLQKSWKYIVENAITIIPSHGKPLSADEIRPFYLKLGDIETYKIFK